jgi:hypothetical protein
VSPRRTCKRKRPGRRRCYWCRETFPARQLVRVVLAANVGWADGNEHPVCVECCSLMARAGVAKRAGGL